MPVDNHKSTALQAAVFLFHERVRLCLIAKLAFKVREETRDQEYPVRPDKKTTDYKTEFVFEKTVGVGRKQVVVCLDWCVQ